MNKVTMKPNGQDYSTLLKAFEAARVRSDEKIEKPISCLKIDGQDVFQMGDISLVVGKAKARKSFATTLLTAVIAGNKVLHPRLFGMLPQNKPHCLYIDTEQSRWRVSELQRRILKLCSAERGMENLFCYSLRPFDYRQRVEFLKWAIENDPYIGLIMLDGVRDLIGDINDSDACNELVTLLMKLSVEYGCHICCVLHQNKGNDHARGHVGTEIVNKAETIIAVTKDEKNPEFSTISAVLTRDREFRDIVFRVDAEGLPVIVGDDLLEGAYDPNNPLSYDHIWHSNVLKAVFFNGRVIASYAELQRELSEHFKFLGIQIGTNKAIPFITYYTHKKLLLKLEHPEKGYRYTPRQPLEVIHDEDDEQPDEVAPF